MIKDIIAQIGRLTSVEYDKKSKDIMEMLETLVFSDTFHYILPEQYAITQSFTEQYEYKTELYRAKQLLESNDIHAALKKFPWYDNYLQVISNDLLLLEKCCYHKTHDTFIFLWSWPLPISAILLALHHDIKVDLVDVSKEAVDISSKLIKKFWLGDLISVRCINAADIPNYNKYQVVYLSAFLSYYPSVVKKVINTLQKSSTNVHIFARTTFGKAKLLYKPFVKKAKHKLHIVTCVKARPWTCNSVYLFTLSNHN